MPLEKLQCIYQKTYLHHQRIRSVNNNYTTLWLLWPYQEIYKYLFISLPSWPIRLVHICWIKLKIWLLNIGITYISVSIDQVIYTPQACDYRGIHYIVISNIVYNNNNNNNNDNHYYYFVGYSIGKSIGCFKNFKKVKHNSSSSLS